MITITSGAFLEEDGDDLHFVITTGDFNYASDFGIYVICIHMSTYPCKLRNNGEQFK